MAVAPIAYRSRGAGFVYGLGKIRQVLRGIDGSAGYLSADPLGPDALAQAAQVILNGLPAGSGVNPIGTAAYPWPHDPTSEMVVDTIYGGFRNVDWYWAHPVADPSRLIQWTGPDSAEIMNGLDNAHVLAANVLLAHGDTSFSADFHPPSALQTGVNPTGGSSSGSQQSLIVTGGVGMPAGWVYTGTNPVAPEALITRTPGQVLTPTPTTTTTTQAPLATVSAPGVFGTHAVQTTVTANGDVVSQTSSGGGGGGSDGGGFGGDSMQGASGGGFSLASIPGGGLGLVALALVVLVASSNRKRGR